MPSVLGLAAFLSLLTITVVVTRFPHRFLREIVALVELVYRICHIVLWGVLLGRIALVIGIVLASLWLTLFIYYEHGASFTLGFFH